MFRLKHLAHISKQFVTRLVTYCKVISTSSAPLSKRLLNHIDASLEEGIE